MNDLRPVTDPAAPLDPAPAPSPGAPSPDRLDAATAEAQIAAIRANKEHPYHRGDSKAVAEMFRLYEAIHGEARDARGVRQVADPTYTLQMGSMATAQRQDLEAAGYDAGVPRDAWQATVDVFLGVKDTLPDAAVGAVAGTEADAWRALAADAGPEAARQTVARAQQVVAALKSISPDVAERIEYTLNASGAGNAPAVVKWFAKLHDLEPTAQRRLVEQHFGLKAAEHLFGPAPRR
jgi:hypothetical protein